MRDFAVKGKSKVIKLFLEKDEIRELKLQNNLGYTPVMSATQVNNLEDWFLELKKLESETKNLSSSSMKELICRGAKGGVELCQCPARVGLRELLGNLRMGLI